MLLLLLSIMCPPSMADGHYEMFVEVCEVTGELRYVQREVLPSISAEIPDIGTEKTYTEEK